MKAEETKQHDKTSRYICLNSLCMKCETCISGYEPTLRDLCSSTLSAATLRLWIVGSFTMLAPPSTMSMILMLFELYVLHLSLTMPVESLKLGWASLECSPMTYFVFNFSRSDRRVSGRAALRSNPLARISSRCFGQKWKNASKNFFKNGESLSDPWSASTLMQLRSCS